MDADTAPFRWENATPRSRACVRARAFLAGLGGSASRALFGAPHLFLRPFLLLSVRSVPSGLGLPCLCCFLVFFLPSCALPLSLAFRVFLGLGVLWSFPPLSFVSLFFPSPLRVCLVFFLGFFASLFFLVLCWLCGAGCVVGCGACWCVLLWALRFGGSRCALALYCSVPLVCASPFCFVACCVVSARWRRAGGVALPLAASGCCRLGVARPSPPALVAGGFFLLRRVCAGCAPLPQQQVVLSCVVVCRASCGVVLRSVVCFVLCPLLCGVLVFLRRVVLGLVVLLLWYFAAFSAGLFLRCSLPFRGAPGYFCFCALLVRCCAGVPASLLSVRCSLAPAALAGVLCCCLLCLRVGCRAWLSSVVSWWVLVTPGVVFRWCAVVCPSVPCCAVLLPVVPPGIVWFRFALFSAVVWCVLSLSDVLGSCVFGRCVLECLAGLCVFCCGVSLRGVVRRSRGGPGHGTLRWTRTSKHAGKALRSQGHHHARVM